MADNYLTRFVSALTGGAKPEAVRPFDEMGTRGVAIFGGYVEILEKNQKLIGRRRYETAGDLLANISIVAASIRMFANLTAHPEWKVEPARDNGPDEEPSDQAKAVAEFIDGVIRSMNTNWTRVVRRSSMYRFHGFGVYEWTAKRRDDGLIGLEDIEQRPQFTIEQWDVEPFTGRIRGMWQRSPQDGALLYLPRKKVVYLVDDTLTDSPEGMGLFRHLVDPAERLKAYLKLEAVGFERDLRGIPVGRAPMAEINRAVKNNAISQAEADKLLSGLSKFVSLQTKGTDTSIMLDSSTYQGTTDGGNTVSTVPKWAVELLSSQGASFKELGEAVMRLEADMARIVGTEGLMLGGSGGSGAASGNRALGEDKSRNLYLSVNGTLSDMKEGMSRDVIAPVCTLNGIPEYLWPHFEVEDVSPKDVEQIAAVLRDMATAGAVLRPDDPVIDDVRGLMGVSKAPDYDPDMDLALIGAKAKLTQPDENQDPAKKEPRDA